MNAKYRLELQNIAGGALQELFENDLEKVIENIYDKNTSFKKARKLTIELKLIPSDESREIVLVDITTKTTLSPVQGVTTQLMLDRNGNKVTASEFGNKMKGQASFWDLEDCKIDVECAEGEIIDKDDRKSIFESDKVRHMFKAK